MEPREWISQRTQRAPDANSDLLAGKCVLVVEDEVIIAMELQAALEDAGAHVIGPAHTLDAALECAAHDELSAAVLDLRLGREPVGPVARLLAQRDVPFVFYSGQPQNDPLRQEWPSAIFLTKPTVPGKLIGAIASLLHERPD